MFKTVIKQVGKKLNIKKVFAGILTMGILSGCVTSKPMTYMQDHSEAYNIAHAAGLYTDINDSYVPAEDIDSVTKNMLDAGFVIGGYGSPQLGMTNWQTAGVNLLSVMLEPDSHGARNSLMAWMPINLANSPADAQKVLISHLKKSIELVLEGIGVKYENIYEKNGKLSIYFIKEDWNCPEYSHGVTKLSDLCEISVETYKPYKGVVPSFIGGVEEERYIFSPDDGRDYHNLNLVISKKSKVPQELIYTMISENLNDWVYLYLAPKKVRKANGETINFPYILNEGKAKLFVTPKL